MADIYIGNVKGPQGDTGATGPQGAAGDAATIQVGTVSTTAYGNPAQVNNSGTEHAAVLNFVIPQGAPGATVTQLDNLALNTITTSTDQYPQIQVGDLGRVIFGKIIKFFQDLVTGLAAKVNYSDALTMEEIEASSDLTDKVSAAAASKSLKDALSPTKIIPTSGIMVSYTSQIVTIYFNGYSATNNSTFGLPSVCYPWQMVRCPFMDTTDSSVKYVLIDQDGNLFLRSTSGSILNSANITGTISYSPNA